LRLKSSNGKEYSLRSIDKSRDDVIPKEVKGTFIEGIIRDGVSMSHPYGALAVAVMQQEAGIYHTLPMVVYLPDQNALDSFNDKFKNDLYLFEQRPEGDWSDAPNLGGFSEYLNTMEVVSNLLANNKEGVDQRAYVKARLFDMLVADWDRHEDNWRWGVSHVNGQTIYIPVPRDRDQAFYAHDGVLIDRMLNATGMGFMQNFDRTIKDVNVLNESSKDMDRFFTSSLSLNDWLQIASELQHALTDTVIAQSIRQIPPAVFENCGKAMIEKLEARRDQLPKYAAQYYRFIAKEVAVTGSKQREHFTVSSLDSGKTAVDIYRVNEQGQKESEPYYQRVFNAGETKKLRVFGIGGNDEYDMAGKPKDIKFNVYDTTPAYKYQWFRYNYKGFSPDILYNNNDRIYAGLKYKTTKYRWDKTSIAHQYTAGVRYSISQNAFSGYAGALYPELLGKWDMSVYAEYDAIRWTNFYGTGNESEMLTKDVTFHRLRSKEWYATLEFTRRFGNNSLAISGYYQEVQNKNDTGRYVDKIFHFVNPDVYALNRYAGVQVSYQFKALNDSIVPTKGFAFLTSGTLSNNFEQKEFFQKYEANVHAYLPLTDHFSLAVHAGGITVVNDAVLNSGQAYQHAILGGGRSLRGYRRERFWGQTAYYNQNELRFITDLRTKIMNGKIGLFGFFDDGRVWIPGENSNKIHVGYGPGLLLAPFNKISATLTYSMSEEISLFQVRVDSKF
jgi:hypothetical protein